MAKRKSMGNEEDNAPATTKKSRLATNTARAKTADRMPASRYTSQQDRAITEFSSVTQVDKSSAAKLLKQSNWNVTTAINAYFSGSNAASNPLQNKINQVFDGYRDDPKENEDELGFDGVTSILGDLDIGLEDIGALVFFEIVESPQLGKITRDGFVQGFSEVSADTPAKMRNAVLARRSRLPTDRALFKDVYNHTFALSLEERKKGIELEQAIELWKVLFTKDGFAWDASGRPWLEWYTEFLTTQWKKAVNKDLWRQTLAFAEASSKDPTLSFWTEESSWPSVIDEFVEWVKNEKKIGDAMDVEQ